MSRPYARNLANNRLRGKQSKALDKSVNNTPMCLFWSSADFNKKCLAAMALAEGA